MQLLPFGDFTEARPVLQKSFITFYLDLLYWLTFLSTFQTALQTLELFLFLTSLTFYDISDKFAVLSLFFISTPHQSSHCTFFFFFFFTLLF